MLVKRNGFHNIHICYICTIYVYHLPIYLDWLRVHGDGQGKLGNHGHQSYAWPLAWDIVSPACPKQMLVLDGFLTPPMTNATQTEHIPAKHTGLQRYTCAIIALWEFLRVRFSFASWPA